MSTTNLLILGGIAGATIFLGLPLGRIQAPAPRLRAFLNALAIGILAFLLVDVLGHANEPVEKALLAAQDGSGSWGRFVGLAALFAVGIGAGLVPLAYYDKAMSRRAKQRPFGPGAAHTAELQAPPSAVEVTPAVANARHLALLIAMGIGLHNFSEGLAIGQSAASGEISLALLLIIGFGLHNATEGFGIVAPLAAEDARPSWKYLATLGVIGGGPTFLGTIVGNSFVNEWLFLAFLAMAAGSILYVVMQLVKVASKLGFVELLAWGVLAGLMVGFATDWVLVAAGT